MSNKKGKQKEQSEQKEKEHPEQKKQNQKTNPQEPGPSNQIQVYESDRETEIDRRSSDSSTSSHLEFAKIWGKSLEQKEAALKELELRLVDAIKSKDRELIDHLKGVIKKTEGEIAKVEQRIKGIYSDRRRHRELDEKIKDAKAARGRTDSPKSQGDITVDFLQQRPDQLIIEQSFRSGDQCDTSCHEFGGLSDNRRLSGTNCGHRGDVAHLCGLDCGLDRRNSGGSFSSGVDSLPPTEKSPIIFFNFFLNLFSLEKPKND